MNTLDEIRVTGVSVAVKNKILGIPKIEEISFSTKIVEDFIERIINDLFEFQTSEQYSDTYNLFNRAFMYVFGKGAEFAFFTRIEIPINRISYDFDKAMHAKVGEQIPEYIRALKINSRISAMLEMYKEMYHHTKGSQERITSEGLSFPDCMRTILHGGFFYGTHICLTIELSEEDRLAKYIEEVDKPYDPDNYTANYKPEDYRVVNYRFGNLDEIKNELF